MINTKCCECMFASPSTDKSLGCSKDIINKIVNIKKISKDENQFNIIENYACRYGFSQKIYDQYKDKFTDITLDQMIQNNSSIKYYLLLDCSDTNIDFDNIINKLSTVDILPVSVSFMFRTTSFRPFLPDKHNNICNNIFKNIKWKAHNFLYNISLNDAISNILSTNSKQNNSSYFLVYDGNRIDQLNSDTITINNNIILYQNPTIAMVDNKDTLYKFFMSFDNYTVAKEISHNLLDSIKNEQDNIIYY